MPAPVLDCGCPATPAYTITKGTHAPMFFCAHHGKQHDTALRRAGFIITNIKTSVPT